MGDKESKRQDADPKGQQPDATNTSGGSSGDIRSAANKKSDLNGQASAGAAPDVSKTPNTKDGKASMKGQQSKTVDFIKSDSITVEEVTELMATLMKVCASRKINVDTLVSKEGDKNVESEKNPRLDGQVARWGIDSRSGAAPPSDEDLAKLTLTELRKLRATVKRRLTAARAAGRKDACVSLEQRVSDIVDAIADAVRPKDRPSTGDKNAAGKSEN